MTTMTDQFIPAADTNELTRRSAVALLAFSELMDSMLRELPGARLEALNNLLQGGGRVGIEITLDRRGENRICLVGIEREGHHLSLMTVQTVARTPVQ
jgi:hypothetical protein